MADEKNLKQEELQDDQLDQVAGGVWKEGGQETVGGPKDTPFDCTLVK